MAWRAAWADEVNLCLEQKGLEERIDHRSFVDQGKAEQPTIHEGVVARVLGDKGIVSDRCELNRQIRRDNALLRQLKAEVQRLVEAVQYSIDYQILIEADYIANAAENGYSKENVTNFINKIMKTESGKRIARAVFCL